MPQCRISHIVTAKYRYGETDTLIRPKPIKYQKWKFPPWQHEYCMIAQWQRILCHGGYMLFKCMERISFGRMALHSMLADRMMSQLKHGALYYNSWREIHICLWH